MKARKRQQRASELVVGLIMTVLGSDAGGADAPKLHEITDLLGKVRDKAPAVQTFDEVAGEHGKLIFGKKAGGLAEEALGTLGQWRSIWASNKIQLPSPVVVLHADSVGLKNINRYLTGLGKKPLKRLLKADLVVLSPDQPDQCCLLSVKAMGLGSRTQKIDQFSKKTTFRLGGTDVDVTGGLGLDGLADRIAACRRAIGIKDKIVKNTGLEPGQWNKLSKKDKDLAVYKHLHKTEWGELVAQALRDAESQLEVLRKSLNSSGQLAVDNVRELLAHLLFGEVENAAGDAPDFYVSSTNGGHRLNGLLLKPLSDAQIRTAKLSARWFRDDKDEDDALKTGRSLVIKMELGGGSYVITKIQPAFDGGTEDKSQTKGIIYYCQVGSQCGPKVIWDFLDDWIA